MGTIIKQPIVTVLLPVYNGRHYLREAIQSILDQTFPDFELIIINDGSSDDSGDIAQSFQDKRIRFYAQQNKGLAATLNRGIALAKGKYIARQDADDFSLPSRLAEQVNYLETHPKVALVGTWSEIWHEEQRTTLCHRHPTRNAELQFALFFDNPFVHSSVMIRRSILDLAGSYSTDLDRQPPEDYELWSRIARVAEIANLPKVLHAYRETKGSISRSGERPFEEKVIAISKENVTIALKQTQTEAVASVVELYHRFPRERMPYAFNDLKEVVLRLYSYAADLSGSNREELKKMAEQVLVQIDHHFPRPFVTQLFRGVLHRLYPNLLNRRKAVRI